MLTDKDLQELLAYRSDAQVLSVYLNTDPTEGNADVHKLHLRSMLKDVDLPADVEAINHYIDFEHDWSGKSIAMFSCAPDNYFRAFSIAIPIRSRVRVSDRPYVKPLADLLDAYGSYGVVLIDKQEARLFFFHLGELREEEEFEGESIRRIKHGGGSYSQAPGSRGGARLDYEEEGEKNIKEAAEIAVEFFKENNVRRILIGGTDENVATFRKELPKAWQSLIVGTFPISMNASHNEVLAKAMQIGEAEDERKEEELAEQIVTNAAKGEKGVLGLDDTLKAVHEGRVQVLLIRDHFQAPGCQCKSCGFLSAYSMESCPFCGGECEQIPDAVELAVRKVMQMGGEVEVLHRDHAVGQFDTIGALLRY